jgi:CspA family cold shock protein
MGKDYESWAPRGRAYFTDGAAPDDPGPWLEPSSPVDAGREYSGSTTRGDASIDGPAVEAMVKWFRADKGYGFVELADGLGDAFLPLKALRLAGLESVPAGAQLQVIVRAGPKGAQVARVVGVGAFSIVEPPERPASPVARTLRRYAANESAAVDVTGRVKWFDSVRGFGFVAGDDFGKDVFVHCSILGPAGVSRLDEGQAVTVRVVDTPKGREAIGISL